MTYNNYNWKIKQLIVVHNIRILLFFIFRLKSVNTCDPSPEQLLLPHFGKLCILLSKIIGVAKSKLIWHE